MCIFAKPPRPGQAKTRLGSVIGPACAAELARAFLIDTWAAVQRLDWADGIVATTDPAGLDPDDVPGATIWPQGPGDLGARMARVCSRALQYHPAAIIIGSDAPTLPLNRLQAARRALATHEAVLGPSDDGGFYLIGLTQCASDLLDDLPWSQPDTLEHTDVRLRASGKRVIRLRPWFDVDDGADLVRLCAHPVRLRRRAPTTAATLTRLGLLQPESTA